MKRFILFITLLSSIAVASCSKTCEVATNEKCKERVPTNELCQVQHSRWFYSQRHDKCELVEYTGCSAKGFATEAECSSCKCNK